MEIVKNERYLEIIKKNEVDKVIFDRIKLIKKEMYELTKLSYHYYNMMKELEAREEDFALSVFRTALDFKRIDYSVENKEDVLATFDKIVSRLDYENYGVSINESYEAGYDIKIFDHEKTRYNLICFYVCESKEIGNRFRISLNYSLNKEGKQNLAIMTAITMYLESTGGYNMPEENLIDLTIESESDINHYIIVSELDNIWTSLNKMNKDHLSFYRELRNNFLEIEKVV